MPQKENAPKITRLTIKAGHQPSRFMVDLASVKSDGASLQSNQGIKEKLKNIYKISSSANPDPAGYEETDCELPAIDYISPEEPGDESWREILDRLGQMVDERFSRLLFYPVLRFLFIIFFKAGKALYTLCYGVGYLLIFSIRFIYLSIRRLAPLLFARAGELAKSRELKPAAMHRQARWQLWRLKIIIKIKTTGIFGRLKPAAPAAKERSESRKGRIIPAAESQAHIPADTKYAKLTYRPVRTRLRPAFYFTLILFILALPFKAFTYYNGLASLKGEVLGITENALTSITDASQAAGQSDFARAETGFSQAADFFSEARQNIKDLSALAAAASAVVPNNGLKLAGNADRLLETGELASYLGNELSQALSVSAAEELDLPSAFRELYARYDNIALLLKKIAANAASIDPETMPDDYQAAFASLRDKVVLLDQAAPQFRNILDILNTAFGFESDQRYLLVFQNNAEMRGSGGFIGSYALADLRNGQIMNLEVPGGGSYDTEAGLYETVKSPAPLDLVSPRWYFWDANWWPDWPLSARKLMWFYENSDGPSVDGVIALTPTVIERLLAITGPIDMTRDYGVIITADNFWLETQTITEAKPDQPTASGTAALRNEPKKIIGDLLPALMEKLMALDGRTALLPLIGTIEQNLAEKQIILYFNNSDLEAKTAALGWDAHIHDTGWDYLMVANTNIAGGKSDRAIRESISHDARIQADGSIIDTLEIKREHTAGSRDPFTGVRNVDWLRIYVPEGSTLLEAGGFRPPDSTYFELPDPAWQDDPDVLATEGRATTHLPSGTKIYTESGKTVFANWSMIDPGETAVITLKYRLPFKFTPPATSDKNGWQEAVSALYGKEKKNLAPYSLLVEKQPGSTGSYFTSRLTLPAGFDAIWNYPDGEALTPKGWQISDRLTTDKYWAIVAEMN